MDQLGSAYSNFVLVVVELARCVLELLDLYIIKIDAKYSIYVNNNL